MTGAWATSAAGLLRGMRKIPLILALMFALSACSFLEEPIEQRVVNWSLANYPGSCGCPFSVDGAGNLCAGQSAWSQNAPDKPVCYASEVTLDLIARYLASL